MGLNITLRDDDLDVLLRIQEVLGMGTIHRANRKRENKNSTMMWTVSRAKDCDRLAEIFGRFPLRNKKQRDFEIWREAVKEQSNPLKQRNLRKMAYLHDKIRLVRSYRSGPIDNMNECDTEQLTLLGFDEEID